MITSAERRYQDYLRKQGVQTANNYSRMLARLRNKEVERVSKILAQQFDPKQWAGAVGTFVNEATYLPNWYRDLIVTAGMPMVRASSRMLAGSVDAVSSATGLFEQQLTDYAINRAGEEIVTVSGTLKETLRDIIGKEIEADTNIGIEQLTTNMRRQFHELNTWQCRRIAQTEMMNALAEAGQETADYLEIPYTKKWCISGLGNTRESHEVMDGIEIEAEGVFQLRDCVMRFPHDTRSNPPAAEIINCACSCIRKPLSASNGVTKTVPQDPTEARIENIMKEMPESLPKETRRAIAKNDLEMEKALGIKKGKPMSIEKADIQSANPKWAPATQYSVNCATCAPAYVLRERGFNITAKGLNETALNKLVSQGRSFDLWKNADGTPAVPTRVRDFLKANNYERMTKKRYKDFLEQSCKEQGTYVLTIAWKGGGGHATILKRLSNGKLVNIEPQHYNKARGMMRDIVTELCDEVSNTRGFEKGVLRVDDKIFDTTWSGLFRTK